MKTINVTIPSVSQKSYPIIIGIHVLDKLGRIINLSHYSSVVVITDKNIEKALLKKIPEFLPDKTSVIVLPEGERMKHIGSVIEIWNDMAKFHCDRKSLVVNIGGGVIEDMGGFAASTYMRGVDFIHIPTTLLSMVDACIGGKTGINFEEVKNLIGTFSQPKAVIIDLDVLQTLPDREFIAGFAEIIKHGLITDKKYFEKVTAKKPRDFTVTELQQIIYQSCSIKADIMQKDEKETGLRKLLNFGHTIGHAIEILSQETYQPLLHGEAVSIGIVLENKIAIQLGILSSKTAVNIEKKLIFAGLPIEFRIKNLELKIMDKIRMDKKNEYGKVRFTLLKEIGKAVINQELEQSEIKKCL